MSRILIVEDETTLLRANSAYFREQGYEVYAAATLADARMYMTSEPPELVILDVMLPDGSGLDFCDEVKRNSKASVIFLTALGDVKDEERGFGLGGDDYLVKPYDLRRLGVRVAAMLRRADEALYGRAEIPPLSLDPATGVCMLDGVSITLTPMEMRLLLYFMKNPNKLIHRDKLYEDVWNQTVLDNAQTVTEHIYRLRKKMGMSENGDSWFKISSEKGEYMFSKVRY